MARIETTCGTCGSRIRIALTDLELVHDRDDEHRFLFACPTCGRPTSRTADPRHLAVLNAIGVTAADARSRSRGHPEAPDRGAPPLTRDDLLRFHELLQTDDWFAQLVADHGAHGGRGAP